MCVVPPVFIALFVVRLNLTCPCNNIFPNREIVTSHNPPPFKGLFYRARSQGHPWSQAWGQLLRGSREDPTYVDLPWATEGVDKAGHDGPTGLWYWQGVHTIAMVMASTLVCLLSEFSLGPPKLTKADIVWAALSILSRWPVCLLKDPDCVDELLWDKKLGSCRLVLTFESLVSHIWQGSRCQIHCTSMLPSLSFFVRHGSPSLTRLFQLTATSCGLHTFLFSIFAVSSPRGYLFVIQIIVVCVSGLAVLLHRLSWAPADPDWESAQLIFCWDSNLDEDTSGQDMKAIKWPLNDV